MTDYLLEAKEVSKKFSGLRALSSVSLTIKKEEIYGVIGPNGAGKTTLFNCLTGFSKPDKGFFLLSGQKLKSSPEQVVSQGIARTFQNIRLFKNLTVAENILVGCHGAFLSRPLFKRFSSLFSEQQYNKCIQWMSYVGLGEEKITWRADALSYGEQRKLEIARALATNPIIIALDEPAAGMNPSERTLLKELIKKIRSDHITVILIEHDIHLVMSLCDRMAVLHFGEKIIEDIPETVVSRPEFISAYLGEDYDESLS